MKIYHFHYYISQLEYDVNANQPLSNQTELPTEPQICYLNQNGVTSYFLKVISIK